MGGVEGFPVASEEAGGRRMGGVEGFPVASNVMRLEAVRVYASFAFGAPIDHQGTLDGGMALGTLVQNLGLGLLVPGLVKVSSVRIALW